MRLNILFWYFGVVVCKKETGRRDGRIYWEGGWRVASTRHLAQVTSVTVLGKVRPGNDKNPNIT